MSDPLPEIRARHKAASAGPWRWVGYIEGRGVMGSKAKKRRFIRGTLRLQTVGRGGIFVMGMRPAYAEPTFQIEGDHCGMRPAGEWVDDFQDYSGHITNGIQNPNATAIERSWEDIEFLLQEVDRLRALEQRLIGTCDDLPGQADELGTRAVVRKTLDAIIEPT